MIYAGIGSRQTPQDILDLMATAAYWYASQGDTLRSGHAPGADQAFEYGASLADGKMEIFLPWRSFEGGCEYATLVEPTSRAMEIAAEFHPRWQYLRQGAKKLHARNTHQVLGANCATPADVILCWTGSQGGTTQALRIAAEYNIPIINLYHRDVLCEFQAIHEDDDKISFRGLDSLK